MTGGRAGVTRCYSRNAQLDSALVTHNQTLRCVAF